MNTIILAELYNQQYPITRISNGNSFFLQENDTGFGFNLEDNKGNIVAKDLPKDKILNVGVQGVILLDGHSYQINTGRKNQPSPKLTRNIVTAYLSKPNDESDLTNDDRIHIFKTILAGSSDVTLDLFKDVCSEYDVDFNQLNKNNDYDFYRFASLVKDLIIHKNNMSIPYDIEHEIISAAYARFQYQDIHQDTNTTPYGEQVKFIENNANLFNELVAANEANQSPKKSNAGVSSVPTIPVFETKQISWAGLGHICDFLLDHDEDKYTLAELKTSSNEHLEFEVLPDNRVIMKGQIYTPVALIKLEVYSL